MTTDGLDPILENEAVSAAISHSPTSSEHPLPTEADDDDNWEPPVSIITSGTENEIELNHGNSDSGLEYVDNPVEVDPRQPVLSSVLEPTSMFIQQVTSIDAVATEDLSGQGKFLIDDLSIH